MPETQLYGQDKKYKVEGIRVFTLGPLNLLYPLFCTLHKAGPLSSFSLQLKFLSHFSSFSPHMCAQALEVWRPRTTLSVILRNRVPLHLRDLSPRSEAEAEARLAGQQAHG